ncbi:Gfo/Idh/MocA family protein [Hamadaea tsunoensis]|uniref:Gfo/Idh/MocA family protein n=1 Tax=Hamadaea tsunoensis TaxID=53368 RepID=UPI00041178A1|nr:Gfo/Idh/MocA family oxidoreductase [Hamadaea tsunoensis]
MISVAIVGTGGIARAHAEAVAAWPERARLTAIAEPDEDRRAAFGDLHGVEHRYASLDDLLSAGVPDLICLCTPPGTHLPLATTALAAGATVLCEKPPTVTLAELDSIVAAGGDRFATVFQHRFGGGAAQLRTLAGSGVLGAPMTAVCDTLWFRPDEYFAVPWRGNWDIEGGGPTLGHGIHQMDLLLSVLGPWQEVVAVAARRDRPTATEDLSAAIVTFASGAVATVVNSLLSAREESYLRFDYRHATVELRHLYGYGDDNWTVTGAPGHEDVAEVWKAGRQGVNSGHTAQFGAVFTALETGASVPVAATEARATLDLVTSIYASAFTRTPVAAGSIGPDSPFYHRLDGTGAPWQ